MAGRGVVVGETVESERSAVWQLLSDVERWPSWTPTVTSIRGLTSSVLAVGSRFEVVQPRLRPVVMEVTEIDPGASFTWRSVQRGLQTEATHSTTAVGTTRTQVELSFTLAGPFAAAVWFVYGRLIRRYVATEASCLRAAAERLP